MPMVPGPLSLGVEDRVVVVGTKLNEPDGASTGSAESSRASTGAAGQSRGSGDGVESSLGLEHSIVEPPPGLGQLSSLKETEEPEHIGAACMHDPSVEAAPPYTSFSGTMTVTSLPREDWKRFFAPGFVGESFGSTAQAASNWDQEEPAMVCPSESLGAEAKVASLAYATVEESSREENALLWSENTRLAMENEMLKRNIQMAWGASASSHDHMQGPYWPPQSPFEMDISMGTAPPFFPNTWYPWMSSAEHMAGYEHQWQGASRSSRARTTSDIPLKVQGMQEGESRRTRANSANDVEAEKPDLNGPCTTVMLRNLPNNYTRTKLLELLDGEGYAGQYDFVYLPMDFKSHASLGYAFVNLLTAEIAKKFWETFEGFSKWTMPSQKVCSMSWSHPHQGLDAHIERYRNSPVMHEEVPEEYKPMVFKDGALVPFPPPTKKLKAPAVGATRAGRQLREAEEIVE